MRQISWKKEAVVGTNAFAAGGAIASTVFGYEAHGFPVAFPKRQSTVSARMHSRKPAGVTYGGKQLEFDGKFDYGHGYPWVQALGGVTHVGGTGVSTAAIASTLPSYSILHNMGVAGRQFVARGCKVAQLDFDIEAPQPGKAPTPYSISLAWEGLETVKQGVDVTTAPTWPATANNVLKGWTMSSGLTFATHAQPDVLDMHVSVMNVLKAAGGGFTTSVPKALDTLEGTLISASVHGNFRGTVNDIFEQYLDNATGSLYIPIDLGAGDYHNITLSNVSWEEPKVIAEKGDITEYTLTGVALDISVAMKDGHDYTSL